MRRDTFDLRDVNVCLNEVELHVRHENVDRREVSGHVRHESLISVGMNVDTPDASRAFPAPDVGLGRESVDSAVLNVDIRHESLLIHAASDDADRANRESAAPFAVPPNVVLYLARPWLRRRRTHRGFAPYGRFRSGVGLCLPFMNEPSFSPTSCASFRCSATMSLSARRLARAWGAAALGRSSSSMTWSAS